MSRSTEAERTVRRALLLAPVAGDELALLKTLFEATEPLSRDRLAARAFDGDTKALERAFRRLEKREEDRSPSERDVSMLDLFMDVDRSGDQPLYQLSHAAEMVVGSLDHCVSLLNRHTASRLRELEEPVTLGPVRKSTDLHSPVTLRFLTWYADSSDDVLETVSAKFDLLESKLGEGPVVAALQDVPRLWYRALRENGIFDWCFFGRDLVDLDSHQEWGRFTGAVLAGRFPAIPAPGRPRHLDGLPLPERGLRMRVSIPGGELEAASIQSLDPAEYGRARDHEARSILSWLSRRTEPTVFGVEAGCPGVDHPDLGRSTWGGHPEERLYGERRDHDLHDAFRRYLRRRPDMWDRVRRERPTGPLAVTTHAGGEETTPARHDRVYASPGWRVDGVEHCYADAVRAGSEHALVTVDLTLIDDKDVYM